MNTLRSVTIWCLLFGLFIGGITIILGLVLLWSLFLDLILNDLSDIQQDAVGAHKSTFSGYNLTLAPCIFDTSYLTRRDWKHPPVPPVPCLNSCTASPRIKPRLFTCRNFPISHQSSGSFISLWLLFLHLSITFNYLWYFFGLLWHFDQGGPPRVFVVSLANHLDPLFWFLVDHCRKKRHLSNLDPLQKSCWFRFDNGSLARKACWDFKTWLKIILKCQRCPTQRLFFGMKSRVRKSV